MSRKDVLVILMLAVYFIMVPVIYSVIGGINNILPVVIAASALTMYLSLKKLRFL